MTKEQPLAVRLYFDPRLYELAKLIGYAGIALVELRKLVEPLGEKFGKEKVQAAADEISKLEEGRINLTPEARKACFQLLGPSPEHPRYREFHPKEPLEEPKAPKEESPPEPPKKRTRRKKVA